MSTTPAVVQIGDKDFTIQRFRGLKAIMAMAAITRITREVPDIMADAIKQYQYRNTVIITEAMSHTRRWEGFTKEDFDAAEVGSGKREIELPAPMTQNEQVMYALPHLLERARKEVVRLLALLIIPNAELRDADKNENVEDALDRYQDVLLYDAELDQLVDLCLVANDVVKEQLADRKDRLGEVIRGLGKIVNFGRNQSNPSTPVQSPQPSPDQTLMQPTSTDDVETSSTDSAKRTDGIGTPRSMESLGASS